MRNITTNITNAMRFQPHWTEDRFVTTLQNLSSLLKNAKIDWDKGAGEKWGRILIDCDVVAYVCRQIPIVILNKSNFPREIHFQNTEILFVSSMDEEKFSVEKKLLESIFGRKISDNWNPAKCSINHLWWATVT